METDYATSYTAKRAGLYRLFYIIVAVEVYFIDSFFDECIEKLIV